MRTDVSEVLRALFCAGEPEKGKGKAKKGGSKCKFMIDKMQKA